MSRRNLPTVGELVEAFREEYPYLEVEDEALQEAAYDQIDTGGSFELRLEMMREALETWEENN